MEFLKGKGPVYLGEIMEGGLAEADRRALYEQRIFELDEQKGTLQGDRGSAELPVRLRTVGMLVTSKMIRLSDPSAAR